MGEGVDIMQAALSLAAQGFPVFPLAPGTKRPAAEHWQAMATTDPERIRQWWSGDDLCIGFTKAGGEVLANAGFNIGVACGGGLLVADADVKKGKQGLASAMALGITFEGFAVRTPTGGVHEYFQGPDVTNSAGSLGEGLDIRSAGGYVVGPGSVVDGVAYVLEKANPPRPAPAALIQRCIALQEKRGADAPVVTPDRPDSVDRALEYLSGRAPLAIEGAAGDVTTFKVAAHLKDIGISQDMAADLMAEHWNDRCSPPWDDDELKTKIANAYDYGFRPIGDLHPMADFKGVAPIAPPPLPPRTGRQWFHHGDTAGRVDWLYYGVLPKVGVALLTAESQAGKTFLAVHLSHSLATGGAFFTELPDDRGATLFLFAGTEGSGFPMRLGALQHEGRLPVAATMVGNLSETNALSNLLEDLRAEARWLLAEYGLPVRLIVLETMAAAALLNDENDNAEAGRAMSNLATIAREMGALVLTSHHPAKDGKGARGASAIPNAADYVMEIKREGQIRTLSLVKARDAEQRTLGTFTLLPVELGKDDRGRPITSMTVSTGEAAPTAAQRAAPHAEKLIEAMEWSMMEHGEELPDGRVGIEESLARDMFKDRKGGSRDRSNVLKTFKAAKGWLQQIGRLDVVGVGTETFLILKTVDLS